MSRNRDNGKDLEARAQACIVSNLGRYFRDYERKFNQRFDSMGRVVIGVEYNQHQQLEHCVVISDRNQRKWSSVRQKLRCRRAGTSRQFIIVKNAYESDPEQVRFVSRDGFEVSLDVVLKATFDCVDSINDGGSYPRNPLTEFVNNVGDCLNYIDRTRIKHMLLGEIKWPDVLIEKLGKLDAVNITKQKAMLVARTLSEELNALTQGYGWSSKIVVDNLDNKRKDTEDPIMFYNENLKLLSLIAENTLAVVDEYAQQGNRISINSFVAAMVKKCSEANIPLTKRIESAGIHMVITGLVDMLINSPDLVDPLVVRYTQPSDSLREEEESGFLSRYQSGELYMPVSRTIRRVKELIARRKSEYEEGNVQPNEFNELSKTEMFLDEMDNPNSVEGVESKIGNETDRDKLLCELVRYKRELRPFNSVLQTDPKNTAALLRKGQVQYRHGRYLDAIKTCTDLVTYQPNNLSALLNRGTAYQKIDSLDMAMGDFNRALHVSPENHYALLGLGNAYRDKGDENHALEYYARAIKSNPNHIGAWIERKKIHQKLYNIHGRQEDQIKIKVCERRISDIRASQN